MNNNLPGAQNTQVALHREKSMINVTDRIFGQRETDLVASSYNAWIQRLWAWADANGVPDLTWSGGFWQGIPRNRESLMSFTTLFLGGLGWMDRAQVELPSEIGKLVNLEAFWVLQCEIIRLPPEIGNLGNLKKLWLGGNSLTELPSEIGKLVNLKDLHLDNNALTELPTEIGKLVNLEELYLNDNALTELPREICKLKKLKKLDLSANQLDLTADQEMWIARLEEYGCEAVISHHDGQPN